ncbi:MULTISPECIES: CaiB/BaiF CoA-transferase family protein [Mycobacteriaceae]|uniref:CaiB/BaiF CoA-transferase family protein n=1 Tax=Mycobacteriaceae TaxID=1762 RepID=UPI000AC08438|nr:MULTISPECIES: CoA transferase [Mycobacteriaceae]
MSNTNTIGRGTGQDDVRLLDDVVVAEAGATEAVAWCGRLLRDLGADVVRIDLNDDALSVPHDALHRGKRRITDVARVDVLVVDGPAGHLQVDPFRARNPKLVVVSVSDYGMTGPAAETPASELTLQAEAGLIALHPTYGRPPVGIGVNLAEQMAGRWAAVGAMAGLLAVTGGAPGTEVDVSRFESLASVLQYPWLMAQLPDSFPYPVPQMAVPGIEPAKDGWVCLVAVSPQQWSGVKQLVGDPRLDDPRYDQLVERIRLAAEVRPLLHDFTKRYTVAELVEMGIASRVAIAPVTDLTTVAEFAPFAARDCILRTEDGVTFPRNPIRVHAAPDTTALGTVGDPSRLPRRPLHGVRVTEIASFQAGPLVGSYLASLGADVIRVESATRPDAMRFTGTPSTVDRCWERAASFAGANVDKRSVAAELNDPRGREIVDRLIASSHVLVENYVPRVLDDRGLDYAGVTALQPNIVMTRMPAWGSTGPWRGQPGLTFTVNAASSVSWMSGYEDGEPLLTGTVFDPIAAVTATVGTLAALWRRFRTGRGAHLEVALCDVALQVSALQIAAGSTGRKPIRSGNRRNGIAPQGVYQSADNRWVAISAISDRQWDALAGAPGMPERALDADLRTLDERVSRHDELDEMLTVMCSGQEAATLVDVLRGRGVPAATVEIGTGLIDHPQLLARQRVFAADHPVAGRARYIGLPARFGHAPAASADRPAPLFGEHSREMLAELGFSIDEIDAWDADGALARSPFGLPFAQPSHQPQQ